MKNKVINELIYIFCLIFFFLSLSYYYADFFDLNRHWTSKYDMEVPIAYNALLFNSAILQEYTDHSAFFTIISSSFYLKILNFFGFVDIYKFSQVVGTNANENLGLDQIFQEIIFHLRCLSVAVNALAAITTTYLFYLIFKRKIFSFILGIIVFYLYGNIDTLSNIRSESFSILFLVLSLIAIKIFFEKNKIIYLVLFFSFLLFSIFQKSQVIFFIPFILLFIFYLSEKKISYDFSFFKNVNKDRLFLQIIFFLVLFITFKSLIFGRDFKTWLFLIFILLVINFYFYKISNRLTLKNNLIIFNFSLIVGYIFFNIIVFLHPSSPLISLQKTIFEVVKHSIIYEQNLSTSTSSINFILALFDLSIKNTLRIFHTFIFSLNIYSIILIVSTLVLILLWKKYNDREKKLLFCIFVSIVFISIINFMRPGDMHRYFVYVDYLFIFLLGVILNKFKNKISLIFAVLILTLTITMNINYIENKKNSLVLNDANSLCKLIEKNGYKDGQIYYFYSWANKIPVNKVKNFCDNVLY